MLFYIITSNDMETVWFFEIKPFYKTLYYILYYKITSNKLLELAQPIIELEKFLKNALLVKLYFWPKKHQNWSLNNEHGPAKFSQKGFWRFSRPLIDPEKILKTKMIVSPSSIYGPRNHQNRTINNENSCSKFIKN